MYKVTLDLILLNDDQNLLKEVNQTDTEYDAERLAAYYRLGDFIEDMAYLLEEIKESNPELYSKMKQRRYFQSIQK